MKTLGQYQIEHRDEFYSDKKFSKLCLITFADGNYLSQQEALVQRGYSLDAFDRYFTYNKKDIDENFYKENKHILDKKRGAGYWLWKPYFILKALSELEWNDIILYMDAGDWITKSPREFLFAKMKDIDILLTRGGYTNKQYTKKDCFYFMGCLDEKYLNAIQVEAGIIVVKKTEFAISIMNSWLGWCKNENCLTDIPNLWGDNYEGFVDHRHDQSVLSLLAIKNNLYIGADMREFVICNF